MEALVIILFIINNLVWMFFLFILTPQLPSRSVNVKLPKISVKDMLKDLTPKKKKKDDTTVDIMNATEEDIAEINKAMQEGMNG